MTDVAVLLTNDKRGRETAYLVHVPTGKRERIPVSHARAMLAQGTVPAYAKDVTDAEFLAPLLREES